MSIINEIKSNPEWKALALANTVESRAELLAALNEPVIENTKTEKVGYRGIVEDYYGVDFARAVLDKLEVASSQDALLKATFITMSSDGLNFASRNTRGQIDTLQQLGVFTSDEAAKLKAIGRWLVSTAKSITGSDATSETVADWCNTICKDTWMIKLAVAYNVACELVDNMTPSEIAQLDWSDIHDMFESEPE